MTFKDFVMSQSSKRKVNHENWSTCVVGEYCREVLGKEDRIYFNDIVDGIIGDVVLKESLNYNGSRITKCRNSSSYFGCKKKVIKTYGDIQDYYNGKLELLS